MRPSRARRNAQPHFEIRGENFIVFSGRYENTGAAFVGIFRAPPPLQRLAGDRGRGERLLWENSSEKSMPELCVSTAISVHHFLGLRPEETSEIAALLERAARHPEARNNPARINSVFPWKKSSQKEDLWHLDVPGLRRIYYVQEDAGFTVWYRDWNPMTQRLKPGELLGSSIHVHTFEAAIGVAEADVARLLAPTEMLAWLSPAKKNPGKASLFIEVRGENLVLQVRRYEKTRRRQGYWMAYVSAAPPPIERLASGDTAYGSSVLKVGDTTWRGLKKRLGQAAGGKGSAAVYVDFRGLAHLEKFGSELVDLIHRVNLRMRGEDTEGAVKNPDWPEYISIGGQKARPGRKARYVGRSLWLVYYELPDLEIALGYEAGCWNIYVRVEADDGMMLRWDQVASYRTAGAALAALSKGEVDLRRGHA